MPPKGWTSGRPEGRVKAVRLTEATIERIARHVERLQAQLRFVRVNEGMAIRHLLDIGLDTVEAGLPQSPTPVSAADVPLASETLITQVPQSTQASIVPQMKQCRNGHPPYPMVKGECPTCVRDRKRRQRQSQPT